MAIGNEEAKLFVAGLPDSVSEDVLKQIFEATGGKVVSVSLPKDRMTGRPRGFGFVTLSTPQEAEAARSALDGSLQGGRSISVRPFQAEPPRKGEGPMSGGPRSSGPRSGGPPQQAPDRTLYVGNLPYDCSQPEVETLINGVVGEGQVVRVHLPMDADGRKRGFGFVTMASSESAKTAAEQLKSADLRGRRLVVNIAHPKGDRPPRSEGGFGGGGGGFGGGGGGFGGGGGGFGGGGGGYGGPPAFGGGGGPPPSRRTFDSDRRRRGGGGGGDGEGGGPKKGRGGGRNRQDSNDDFDWRKAGDKDDE
jgi:RNA recognition motif-containing protein